MSLHDEIAGLKSHWTAHRELPPESLVSCYMAICILLLRVAVVFFCSPQLLRMATQLQEKNLKVEMLLEPHELLCVYLLYSALVGVLMKPIV